MIIPRANRLQQVKEYYFASKLKEIRHMQEKGIDVINLGIGSPDLAPPKEVIEALHQCASQEDTHGYQSYNGIPELRKAITGYMSSTYDVSLNHHTEILPLMGSKEGISHISLAFLNPGDEVLIPELGYPAYRSVSNMVGAITKEYPLTKGTYLPDFDALEKQNLSKVKLMWVNYPHMPTGTPATLALFQKLVSFAKEHHILICHDNPYSQFLNDTEPLSIFNAEGAKEVCIELGSMSKSFNMAGWRIGWVAGAEEYLKQILRIKSNVDSGMFRGMQEAAIKALSLPKSWHKQRNDIYRERRDYVCQIMDKLNCQYKKDLPGMFVWGKLPEHIKSSEQVVDDLLKNHHIFITPGSIFGPKGDRFIRISLCIPVESFKTVLKRINNITL